MLFNGKATANLTERPNCDLCQYAMFPKTTPAAVDGVTTGGSWGYMCVEHFRAEGHGLGEGHGQVLFCNDEHDEKLAKTFRLKPNTTSERIAVYGYELAKESKKDAV